MLSSGIWLFYSLVDLRTKSKENMKFVWRGSISIWLDRIQFKVAFWFCPFRELERVTSRSVSNNFQPNFCQIHLLYLNICSPSLYFTQFFSESRFFGALQWKINYKKWKNLFEAGEHETFIHTHQNDTSIGQFVQWRQSTRWQHKSILKWKLARCLARDKEIRLLSILTNYRKCFGKCLPKSSIRWTIPKLNTVMGRDPYA